MTASRTCRACGASLAGDVTWCVRCYEPVRHLTPRAPQLPLLPTPVVPTSPGHERSRWKAGVNTFGPFGRLAATGIVLLMAPLSTNPMAVLVLWPCYLVLAGAVLRSVWKKDRVVPAPTAEAIAAAAPRELAPEPRRATIPRSTYVAWGVLIVAVIALSIAWGTSGHVVRGSIAVAGSIAALVLWIRFAIRS